MAWLLPDCYPNAECVRVADIVPAQIRVILIALMSEDLRDDNMRNGDVALRFSIVFAVVGFITMAAGIYEIDRREKSSSATVTANLTGIEQRVQILSDQIRILNDQYTRQINNNEQQLHSLDIQIQALESRLNELEDHLRVRR